MSFINLTGEFMKDVWENGIKGLQNYCHNQSLEAGWWTDIKTGLRIKRNRAELLMLIVSEISEAMEGERKDLMDDKLPHRKMAEVELADAVIRIFDYSGGYGYDIASAIKEKLEFNSTRDDHKVKNRKKIGGKKF